MAKQKRSRGDGSVYRRHGSKFWWIKFYALGKVRRKSSGTTDRDKAEAMLRRELLKVADGQWIDERKVTVVDLLEARVAHLKRKRKDWRKEDQRAKPLREFFGTISATRLRTGHIEDYQDHRLEADKKNATINREVAALRAAFNLGIRTNRITQKPPFPEKLDEDNVRQGVVTHAQMERIVESLPAHLQDLTRFAYLFGWRAGAILELKWSDVQFDDKVPVAITQQVDSTKKPRARRIPVRGVLLEIIRRRLAARRVEDSHGVLSFDAARDGFVFHRNGKQIKDFRGAWAAACKKSGVNREMPDGKVLFHDLRRSAVTAMDRRGIDRAVAMRLTGHKTESVYTRYQIDNEEDLEDAVEKCRPPESPEHGDERRGQA